jgi:Ca-activated chloride channel homolog
MPFRVDAPWLLLALLVVPVLFALARLRRGRAPGTLLISSVAPLAGVRQTRRQRLRWLPAALRLLGITLIVLALARPQVGRASSKVPAKGIDIVIALDISGSMSDPGLSAGSKLQGAKQAIKQFIDSRKNDRVGMVVFESQARVVSPLTLDYNALDQLVDQVHNGLLPDGTAIGVGLANAVNLLRGSQAKSRVIILATDGENNQFEVQPETAAQIAASLHMKLYTIGMLAANETPQTTQVNETLMAQLAQSTGGFYGRAQTESDLQNIFNTISKLETSRVERAHYTVFDELEGWLVVPGIALLALEATLGATLFRRTA